MKRLAVTKFKASKNIVLAKRILAPADFWQEQLMMATRFKSKLWHYQSSLTARTALPETA